MPWTDDPVADAENYYQELEEEKSGYPICEECGDHIVQDTAVYIGGNWYCDNCISNMRISTGG